MKKVPVLPFLLSLSPVLVTFVFALISWKSADSAPNSGTITSPPAIVTKAHVTTPIPTLSIKSLPLEVPAEAVPQLDDLHDQVLQEKLEEILHSNSRWTAL